MQDDAASHNTHQHADPGQPLEHGGRLAEARRRFPDAPAPFLDLSTGINPVAYPVGNIPQAAWARLPEPDALDQLQAAAATAYGACDPAMIVAAPGTQILISLLPRLLPQDRVSILGPTYAEHAAAWQHAGIPTTEVEDVVELHHARCAVLCNPNNPDGRRWSPPDLLALADSIARRDGLLIVDEAFADMAPEWSLVPYLPHPALLILRSFGKAFGLAGLRLGFSLTLPSRASRLRAALGPWAVSGPAIAIANHALADRAWIQAARIRLAHDATRLDALLLAAGLHIVGGTTLFRLATHDNAPALFDRLGQAGILVRRFSDRPRWLRFGLPGDQPGWDRLAAALRT